jgi:hypothetical protein
MRTTRQWCDECKAVVEVLHVNQAAALAGMCRRSMYIWMERGWVHCMRSPSRRWVICRASLLRTSQPAVTNNVKEWAIAGKHHD